MCKEKEGTAVSNIYELYEFVTLYTRLLVKPCSCVLSLDSHNPELCAGTAADVLRTTPGFRPE